MKNEETIPYIYDGLIARTKKSDSFLNKFIDKILREKKVRKVWDASCGTGNQVRFLAKKGYDILASDINETMVKLAKNKLKGLKVNWMIGNMRDLDVRKNDAIISIYNSILHLNEDDLTLTFNNFYKRLNKKGILIFDVFNKNLLKKKFPKHRFIQKIFESNGKKYVLFNKVSYEPYKKLMISDFELYTQAKFHPISKKKFKINQYIYSKDSLIRVLKKTGFESFEMYDSKGKKFDEDRSIFLLIIAKK